MILDIVQEFFPKCFNDVVQRLFVPKDLVYCKLTGIN